MDDELQEAVRDFSASAARAALIFAERLQPVVDSIIELWQKTREIIHAEYVAAGEIYGDTDEGMLRWLQERTEIARLRQQADRIEQRHQMLADFRARVRR